MPSKNLRSRKKWRSTLRIWNISIFGQVYLVADAGCDECGDVWRMFEKGQDMKCRRQCRITFWIFYCMKSRHVFWMLFMERCASDSCRNIIVVLDGNSRAVVVLCCLQSGFFSFWLMMGDGRAPVLARVTPRGSRHLKAYQGPRRSNRFFTEPTSGAKSHGEASSAEHGSPSGRGQRWWNWPWRDGCGSESLLPRCPQRSALHGLLSMLAVLFEDDLAEWKGGGLELRYFFHLFEVEVHPPF